jgi:hypothetical protein
VKGGYVASVERKYSLISVDRLTTSIQVCLGALSPFQFQHLAENVCFVIRVFKVARDDYTHSVIIASLFTLTKCTTSLNKIRMAAANDTNHAQLIKQIQDGFPPSRQATPPSLREFWEVRHRLSTLEGVAFLGHRTVIPSPMCKQMLEFLHSAHQQGVTGMKARANETIYWLGMDATIKQ